MLPAPRPLVVAAAVICFCFGSTLLPALAEGKVRYHKWDISYQQKSPDGFKKLAVTINGEAPGPIIRATRGDTIVVDVHNKLETENTAIHWHGIRQIGTPWADGVGGVTQCPILPGETFTYKFVVDRAGTYLYHAHYGMQRVAGLNGMIVVAVPDNERKPFTYDEERTVLLEDWWHQSVYDQATGLSGTPFKFVGEPQSLLINGQGMFNCSKLTTVSGEGNDSCIDTALPNLFIVVPGKTYLLRIGSLTSLSSLSFEIEGHSMTVVEADGHYVRPFVVRNLFIYSGETYSVLIKADQDPRRNYWAVSKIVGRNGTMIPSARAIVSYAGNDPLKTPPTTAPTGPPWNNVAIRVEQSRAIVAHPSYHGLTTEYDQRPPLDMYDHKSHDISAPAPTNGTVGSPVYRLAFESVVDIVLQNSNMLNNISETHPWHLHGHDFWVLGHGDGKFDPAADAWRLLNVKDPIMKNTVPLHPDGWTALRFRANNPGVWLFHCHIEAHVHMGMGVVLEEGVEKVGRLPSSIMGCGRSKGLH
ncbi:unnamed protein product [Alopecurus aequalis]